MRYVLILLFLVGCQTTEAQQRDYDALAQSLMYFAASETGKQPAPVPEVEFRDLPDGWRAAYDPKEHKMLLSHKWEADTIGMTSLAHELTHAIQHHNEPDVFNGNMAKLDRIKSGEMEFAYQWVDGMWQDCVSREREAYLVGYAYQAVGGVAPENPQAAAQEMALMGCKRFVQYRDSFPRGDE